MYHRNHLVPGFKNFAPIDALDLKHLENDFIPVYGEFCGCDAEQSNLAAIIHFVNHVAQGMCSAGHLQSHIKAFGHTEAGHYIIQVFVFSIDHMLNTHVFGQLNSVVRNICNDNFACADALCNQSPHNTDRACAGDQYIFTDKIKAQCGMHCVTERIKYGGDFVGNVVRNCNNVVLRQTQIFCKRSRSVNTHSECITAQVSASGSTISATATNYMSFTRYALTCIEFLYCRSGFNNLAAKLVAYDHRRGYCIG